MSREAPTPDCSALALLVLALALFDALSCAALLACSCLVLAVTLDPTSVRAARAVRAFRVTSPPAL